MAALTAWDLIIANIPIQKQQKMVLSTEEVQ